MEDTVYDGLAFNEDKKIIKMMNDQQETLLLSMKVFKFNDRNKRQVRNMLVTSRHVYNLDGKTVKRKILISKIGGFTIQEIGTQFVLHVPEEYDYRFSHYDRREVIIGKILQAYEHAHGKGLEMNYVRDLAMEKYQTTEKDKKNKVSRQPKGRVTSLGEWLESAQKSSAIQEQKRKSTQTIFTKNDEVSLYDFDCLKVLGRGSYGKVMLVMKKDSGELYAMKSLRKEDMIRKQQVEHTKTEKMILQDVTHPFLVKLAHCFQTPEKLFLVMEFQRGGEMFQHLRVAGRFTEGILLQICLERARFYACQLILALQHLHSHNIIYRDLKPENILLDAKGNAMITDFGLAKQMDTLQTDTLCGTPEYLAPEQLLGLPYGKTSDWWTLGCLLFEMQVGQVPFYNSNQSKLFSLIRECPLSFPKGKLHPQSEDLITKLLAKDPKQRLGYEGADEIKKHPWFDGIDWDKVVNREYPAPFVPKVEGDDWVGNFDREFTSEEPVNSFVPINNRGLLNKFNETDFQDF